MIRFGTGGWRAVIGEDFIQENVRKVAAGVLRLMQEENKTDKPVIIGFDRRFLSENAARWVAEVLAKGGIHVVFYNEKGFLKIRTVGVLYVYHFLLTTFYHFVLRSFFVQCIIDDFSPYIHSQKILL